MPPLGHLSYLTLLLLWVAPVYIGQWTMGRQILWKERRVLLMATLFCGTFLSLADHYAIAHGIWQIHDAGIVGWRLQGHLPLEEALFFYLTSGMCAQGFILLCGYFESRAIKRQEPRR